MSDKIGTIDIGERCDFTNTICKNNKCDDCIPYRQIMFKIYKDL